MLFQILYSILNNTIYASHLYHLFIQKYSNSGANEKKIENILTGMSYEGITESITSCFQ